MITILDYGLGNPVSIKNMIKRVGGKAVITDNREQLLQADKIIVPGVGHFKKGMENLTQKELLPVLNKKALEEKIPVLGICLGMQLLTCKSEEGGINGLGWIEAQTIRFEFPTSDFKVPHMGWTEININNNHPIFRNLPESSRFYFVHSYYVVPEKQENVLCTAEYGGVSFAAGIVKDNIIGLQFHPEKSHKYGMQLIKNFIEM